MSTGRGGFFERARRLGSRLRHSSIDVLGEGTLFAGRPDVVNDGVIEFGRNCRVSSHPVRSHFMVMPRARIAIGDEVMISYGAGISAASEIQIGSGTRIGPFCVMLDSDYHKAGDRDSAGAVAPIHVGQNVRIGARVTLLRGSRVGAGATVMSGSCVSGFVAEGAVVSGVPARTAANEPFRRYGATIIAVAARAFSLQAPLRPADRLGSLPGWDRNGPIRLMLGLEEALGVRLSEQAVRAEDSVSALAARLDEILARGI
jgi:acetyltransferase-like isoleucine patch superfamily enzyme